MDRFVRSVRLVSQWFGYVAAGLIGLGVIIVCHMVFVRYVLNENTVWQTDFVTFSIVAATFIGSPFVLLTRGHVNVDLLPHNLGPRGRYWLAVFTVLLALSFTTTMAVLTALYWHEAWANAWRSNTIWRVRLWIPYASMPIGLTMLTLQYVADLGCLLTGREPPFGLEPREAA